MSDKGYVKNAKRATLAAFVLSFAIFTTAQWFLPSVFNFGRPNGAQAATASKVWSTTEDFSTGQTPNVTKDASLYVGSNGGDDGNGSIRLANNPGADYGAGEDGPLKIAAVYNIDNATTNVSSATNTATGKITGRTYADAIATTSTAQADSNTSTITVTSTTGLAVGSEVFIAKFWKGSNTSTGLNEFNIITAVNGNILTLSKPLAQTYPMSSLVQRVPHYTTITINAGGVLQATAWNGVTGGVVVFRANGAVNVVSGGKISATGLGYPVQTGPKPGSSTTTGYACGEDTYTINHGGGGGGYAGAGGMGGDIYCELAGDLGTGAGGGVNTALIDFGSGGSAGSGGGAILGFMSSLNNPGVIESRGVDGGGGAGGSINLTIGIAGWGGTVSANGGSGAAGGFVEWNYVTTGSGGGGGGQINISANTNSNFTVSAAGGAGGAGVPVASVNGGTAGVAPNPVYNYTLFQTYLTPGNLGTGGVGLRFDNSPSKSKWKTISVKGYVGNGTTVKFQVRAGETLGVNDSSGTNGFVNPTSYTQLNTWGTTIPIGDYSSTAYTINLDTAMPLSKTFEIIMQLSGGTATPRVDSITLGYDNLDAPTLANMSISSATNGTFSSAGTENTWTKDTSINFNVPTASFTCTGCGGTSTNRRSQVEVKNIDTAFGSTVNDYIEDGGVSDLDGVVNGTVRISQTTQSVPATFVGGGSYHWRARVVDNEGRVSGWTSYGSGSDTPMAGADFSIDQTGPTQPGTPITITPTNNNKPTWAWTGSSDTASGLNSYIVYWDTVLSGATYSTTSATNSFTHVASLADGTWYLKVVAKDNAGNIGTEVTSAVLIIDTTNPTQTPAPTITSSPNNTGNQTITWATFNDSGASSGFKKYVVQRKSGIGGTYSDLGSPITSVNTLSYQDNSNLAEGSYYYRVNAYDNVDNFSLGTDSLELVVDKTAPAQISIVSVNPSTNNTGNEVVAWSASSDSTGSGFGKYVLQRKRKDVGEQTYGAYQNVVEVTDQGQLTYGDTGLLSGNYLYRVVVYDKAGNYSNGTDSELVTIDSQVPSGTILINDGYRATASLNVKLSLDLEDEFSGVASYQLSNDGGIWSAPTDISSSGLRYQASNVDWDLENTSTEGQRTVYVRLLDKAGNETSNITGTVYFDTSDPTLTHAVIAKNGATTLNENGASQGWYPYTDLTFEVKGTDEISGIKYFKYCFFKQGGNCIYQNTVSSIEDLGGNTYRTYIDITDLNETTDMGVWTLQVKGVDFVDRDSANTSTYIYKFDAKKPTSLTNFSASKGSENTSVKLSWDDPFVMNNTSRAPIQKFKVERVKAADYTPGYHYNGDWSSVSSYYSRELDVVADAAALIKSGVQYNYYDTSMLNSVKYLYRVSAKDYSNYAFGDIPYDPDLEAEQEFVNNGYGFTQDKSAPEIYPSAVTVVACDGQSIYDQISNPTGKCTSLSNKGKETKIQWLPAQDNGAGVKGYEIWRVEGGYSTINGWEKVNQTEFLETNDSLSTYRVFFDNTVVDAKTYSYRILAYDDTAETNGEPNKTLLARGNDFTDYENATQNSVNVPDIHAPVLPSLSLTSGLDYIPVEETDPGTGEVYIVFHQKVVATWAKTTDNNPQSGISFKLYRSTNGTDFDEVSAQTQGTDNTYTFEQTGLPDRTTYYYYLKVEDSFGNAATTQIKSVATGNSKAPTQPTSVEVRNDIEVTDPGTELRVKFRGSWARQCNESTGADCIVGYEGYVSTTNIEGDTANITQSTTDDCLEGETQDACWIRINQAEMKYSEEIPPTENETLTPKRSFSLTGLEQSTQYFVRIRALDNNTESPLYSQLSTLYLDRIHNTDGGGGWDITRDTTAPELPAGGLEVKVKDTHPNSAIMRNIISWKILDKTPKRKKLAYETCEIIVENNIEYCKDFGRYEIYRQILDGQGNVVTDTELPIQNSIDLNDRGIITDADTNYYIDSIGINELLGGSERLIDAKIKYYVRVFDDSMENFKYPDGQTNINSAANKTDKQLSLDSIIPASAKPKLVGGVGVSNISVASATVVWQTDQDTDSLVQYRPMKKDDSGNWLIDDSKSFITIGQVERTVLHSVNLFGLKPNTRYEYKLVSRNYLDNRAEYDESAVPALETTGFSIISGKVVTTTTGAEINWSTNLDAESAFIEYQMNRQPGDDPQGKTVGVNPDELAAKPKDHRVVIQGLKSNRTYTYKIKSLSKDGFIAETEFSTFVTKTYDTSQFTIAPSSSNVAERNITSTTAQIVWVTSSPGTSWVDYATKAGIKTQDRAEIKSSGSNELNTQHAVQIDGLVPGTRYYYIVRSKDANDIEYTSQEYSFMAILKPKISNMRVSDVTPYSITIEWETNVDTETLLNWGKTGAYGEKRGKNEITKVHKISVDGLDDNTEYHYQILAKDETGNEVADDDKIIRTPLDTEGPQILNVKTDILPIGTDDAYASVIVSWQTNKPATTLVEYDEGIIGGKYTLRSTEDKTLNNSHTVIIKELKPAASYHFKIVSKDKRGNIGQSPDHTFVTPSKEKSILQLILKSLEETFSWTKNMGKFFGNIGKRATGEN